MQISNIHNLFPHCLTNCPKHVLVGYLVPSRKSIKGGESNSVIFTSTLSRISDPVRIHGSQKNQRPEEPLKNRSYHPPRLIVYGAMRNLTAGGSTGAIEDNNKAGNKQRP